MTCTLAGAGAAEISGVRQQSSGRYRVRIGDAETDLDAFAPFTSFGPLAFFSGLDPRKSYTVQIVNLDEGRTLDVQGCQAWKVDIPPLGQPEARPTVQATNTASLRSSWSPNLPSMALGAGLVFLACILILACLWIAYCNKQERRRTSQYSGKDTKPESLENPNSIELTTTALSSPETRATLSP
jgi:hypothetical protein